MPSDRTDYLALIADTLPHPSPTGHRARAGTLIRAALKELDGHNDAEEVRQALLNAKNKLEPGDASLIGRCTLH